MYVNPAAIGQGVRMAGQILGNVARVYPAQTAAGAGLLVGVPAVMARRQGELEGYYNPEHSGIGGTVSRGLFNPLAGIAYGQGHQAGRERAQPNELSPQEIKQIQEYLKQQEWEKRKQMLQGIMNPVFIKN